MDWLGNFLGVAAAEGLFAVGCWLGSIGFYEGVSEQFQSSFREVSEKFQRSFGEVSERFRSNLQ